MNISELSAQQRDRLLSAQDPEELKAIAAEEDIELTDELLEDVAGGWDFFMFDHISKVYPQGDKPSVIC